MEFADARNYKKQIKKLYRSAFPRNERAPLSLLFHRTENGRDSFYAVLDKGNFIGLLYTIRTKKMVYLFFLAVTEENRGKGYGTKILGKIRELYPEQTISLMIEDTNDPAASNLDERLQRLRFYERNGFRQLHININEAGVDYELLGTDNTITQADFLAMMKEYVGSFLYKILYRKTKAE